MRLANHRLLRALALTLGTALLGGCGDGTPPDPRSDAFVAVQADRGAPARGVCAALTEEVTAITGLRLRHPLDLSAPGEGLLRGCTWSEEDGGLNVFALTKETADQYERHDEDHYRRNFPDRFKALEEFGDRAYVSPNVNDGWVACALRGQETFFVEIEGEATTEEQALRLLRLAIDRL